MKEIDITSIREFTRGVARFSLIAFDHKTGVQAWRRTYTFEPLRNCVDFIIPKGGKYYPEENEIKRRISARDPRLREKIDFYLQNGLSAWFPGDEPRGIYEDE